MSSGRWYVYCRGDRAITLDELAGKLSHQQTRLSGATLTVVGNDAAKVPVEVSVERGAQIRDAGADLADRTDMPLDPGVPEPDRDTLRASDVRYVLDYDADRHYDVMNTVILIAGAIEKACGGVIHDQTSDRFA